MIVRHLFLFPARGAAGTAVDSVSARRHAGLIGDRWHRSRWTYALRWLNARRKGKAFHNTNLSLITLADLAHANAMLAAGSSVASPHPGGASVPASRPFTPLELRRNVVLDGGLDLNALLGKRFQIGNVLLRGDNLCTPCALPPQRVGRPELVQPFLVAFGHPKFGGRNLGGLRAHILTSGTIHVGDRLLTTDHGLLTSTLCASPLTLRLKFASLRVH